MRRSEVHPVWRRHDSRLFASVQQCGQGALRHRELRELTVDRNESASNSPVSPKDRVASIDPLGSSSDPLGTIDPLWAPEASLDLLFGFGGRRATSQTSRRERRRASRSRSSRQVIGVFAVGQLPIVSKELSDYTQAKARWMN